MSEVQQGCGEDGSTSVSLVLRSERLVALADCSKLGLARLGLVDLLEVDGHLI